jgi:PHP family Zn ribbon phosphoesterase
MDTKLISVILQNREGKIKVKPGCDGIYGIPILDVIYDKKQKSLMDF